VNFRWGWKWRNFILVLTLAAVTAVSFLFVFHQRRWPVGRFPHLPAVVPACGRRYGTCASVGFLFSAAAVFPCPGRACLERGFHCGAGGSWICGRIARAIHAAPADCLLHVLVDAYLHAAAYKTPWCLLGFYHGMVLLAGVGVALLWRACGLAG